MTRKEIEEAGHKQWEITANLPVFPNGINPSAYIIGWVDAHEKMEEYAKQEAIAFAKWMPANAVIAEDGYYYLHLKDLKEISPQRLYSEYQKSKQ